MPVPLRVLVLEDNPADAELAIREISRAGFEPEWQRVDTQADYLAHLTPDLDLILADYHLPQFDAQQALGLLNERGLDIPFIVVSGTIGEEAAVHTMQSGAADYLLKDRLARLGPAVTRALERRQMRATARRAEERYRGIVENALEGIFQIAPDGRLVAANPALARMLGYGSAEELLLDKSGSRWLLGSDESRAEIVRLADEQGGLEGFELPASRRDGAPLWLSLSVRAVRESSGGIVLDGTASDVTERRRAQAALEEALTEVRARNEAISAMSEQLWQHSKLVTMGELAASVAHELNNPMATISLRIESVLAGLPPEDPRRQPLEVVEGELERMSRLVANLLQFSRRSTAQISTVDVVAEVEKSLELIDYRLRSQGVRVVREVAADLPAIHADRQQLRQLFLNLLTNAADAMLLGGTLTIRANGEAPAVGPVKEICIEIEDTGTGIAPEDLPRVTEPFFTTKPEGKGTGLGLLICSRVVQGHHGRLELRSELGKGTTVRVVLPVANSVNGKSVRSSAPEEAGREQSPGRGGAAS